MDLNDVLAQAIAENEVRARKSQAESDAFMKKSKADQAYVMSHLRPATLEEYRAWLEAFVAKNHGRGKVDWQVVPFAYCKVFVAKSSFRMLPVCGAAAIQIIVPKKFEVRGPTGHSSLMLEGGELKGDFQYYIRVPLELSPK